MQSKENVISLLQANKQAIYGFGIRAVGLFGSYVRNEQSLDSDIDLLIDFHPDQGNFDNLMAVCDFFDRLFSGEHVEVVTAGGLSPYIGPLILKEVQYV